MSDATFDDHYIFELIEQGFTVFPVGSPLMPIPQWFIGQHKQREHEPQKEYELRRLIDWGKRPLVRWQTYQDKPPSYPQIEEWLAKHKNCNWGIVTGINIVVVDCDSEEAGEFLRSGLITRTPWVTYTGRGYHFIYQVNPNIVINNSTGEKAKIDIRGVGGFVLAPGSTHGTGAVYKLENNPANPVFSVLDLPTLCQADLDLIDEKNGVGVNGVGGVGGGSGSGSGPRSRASGEPVGEGSRNDSCASLAGQDYKKGFSLQQTLQHLTFWNKGNRPPLPQEDVETTLISMALTHTRNHPNEPIRLYTDPALLHTILPVDGSHTITDYLKKMDARGFGGDSGENGESGNTIIDPAYIYNDTLEKPQFPAHLYELEGALGELMTLINGTAIRPQPLFALNTALVLVALLSDRKYCTPTGAGLNIYITSLAETGAGKEHARKIATKILDALDVKKFMGGSNIASGAGLLTRVSKAPNVLFQLDEFGLYLQSLTGRGAAGYQQQVIKNLMELYTSSDGLHVGTEYADQKDRPREDIDRPHVYINATTTPSEFWKALTSDYALSGFINRLLITEAEETRTAENQNRAKFLMSDDLRGWANSLLNFTGARTTFKDNGPMPPMELNITTEAADYFKHYDNTICTGHINGPSHILHLLYTRAYVHAAKLASILALSHSPTNPEITLDHLKWAIEYTEYSIDLICYYADKVLADSQDQAEYKQLLNLLREAGPRGVTKRDFARNPYTIFNKKKRDSLLSLLLEAGLVAFGLSNPGEVGRPRHAYVAIKDRPSGYDNNDGPCS